MEHWTKSSYSGGREPNCVECRIDGDRVLIRDTRHRNHGRLSIPRPEWAAFLAELRRGGT